jgi:23S rRNA (cytidine1920-2'-O)/16S rRNA (cytidine1409-2'-O)-methyltransferase
LRLVLARNVLIREGEVVKSPAEMAYEIDKLRIRGRVENDDGSVEFSYVARSAKKLVGAIDAFNLGRHMNNSICIDIGSSTGGFTQVLLLHDAKLVYAIDVGTSILDYQLRIDPRVKVLEKTNARYVNESIIPDAGNISVVVCDVSFISLKLVLPPSLAMCKPGAIVAALIKPQFECDRNEVGDKGIITDETIRLKAVESICGWFQRTFNDWALNGTIESPITGTQGNQEYILVATKIEML